MPMTTHVLIVDILAILLVVIGAHLAFRQRQVLGLLSRLTGKPPRAITDESPAHYAMIIFGIMLAAFGIIIFGFTTLYGVFTAAPAH